MLKHDLEAASIPYVDGNGRYADFHALRHTFIMNMVKSGVAPKTAQALGRHSLAPRASGDGNREPNERRYWLEKGANSGAKRCQYWCHSPRIR